MRVTGTSFAVRRGAVIWLALLPMLALPAAPGARPAQDTPPTEATLGVPIYPSATFLTSYDAGRGQRYFLFGTQTTFEEMVRYYAVVLDERGDRVFDAPATHVFQTGRFRDDRMAFPPSVTIRDHTWNGSEGFLNPNPGQGERYATIIQVVPPPAEESR